MSLGLERKQLFVISIILFGSFVAVLNSTVISPVLPHVMAEMNIDAAVGQWLTTGFTMVNAIMIPVTAFLQDKFSTRRLFAVSLGIFTIGTLFCSWSPNFPVLLGGRLIQAAGEGILMPLTGTVLILSFPFERRGLAMGLFGLVLGFAPAVGPTVAGLIIDNSSWRIMFLIIAGLSALTTAIGFATISDTVGLNPKSTLDVPSVVSSTIGFGGLLFALSELASVGFTIPNVLVLLLGLASLVYFFHRQLHLEVPMLQIRVLASRKFLISTIITMLLQPALMAGAMLIPIYLQTYRGFSATVSGLVLMPGALMMAIMGLVAGRLFDKHGARVLSITGTGILCISTLGLSFLNDSTVISFITLLYTIRLFSLALVNMPIGTWGLNALENKMINHGNSVMNTLRMVASSMGTAIIVSFSTMVTNNSMATMDATHAGIHGVNMAFIVATALTISGFLVTVFFVRDGLRSQAGQARDKAIKDPTNEHRTLLEAIMNHDAYVLPETATVKEAVALFVEKGISAAPLVDANGKAVGFISDGDVLRCLSPKGGTVMNPVNSITRSLRDFDGRPEFGELIDHVMDMRAMDIGARGALGVDIHADLAEICRFLGSNHLKKALVLDEGRVVGVINRSAIMRFTMKSFLQSQQNGANTQAFETVSAVASAEEPLPASFADMLSPAAGNAPAADAGKPAAADGGAAAADGGAAATDAPAVDGEKTAAGSPAASTSDTD